MYVIYVRHFPKVLAEQKKGSCTFALQEVPQLSQQPPAAHGEELVDCSRCVENAEEVETRTKSKMKPERYGEDIGE